MPRSNWINFKSARIYVRKLKLQTYGQYLLWARSNKRPDNIPIHPQSAYKKEFISWQDFLGHKNRVPNKTWSLENLIIEAKKYNTVKEFQDKAGGAYTASLKSEHHDIICAHMKPADRTRKYTFSRCLNAAKKCKFKNEFAKRYKPEYATCIRKGWLKEIYKKAKLKNTPRKRLSQKQAIENLKKVYGDTYDLTKVKYIKANDKIIVICRKHGSFTIAYNSFQQGHICRECANENISKSRFKPSTSRSFAEVAPWISIDPNKNNGLTNKDISAWSNKKIIITDKYGNDHHIRPNSIARNDWKLPTRIKQKSDIELKILLQIKRVLKDKVILYPDPVCGYKIDGLIKYKGKKIIFEYDGYYYHKDIIDNDKIKNIKFKRSGYEIIRIRERPLTKLGKNDILVASRVWEKEVPGAVISFLDKISATKERAKYEKLKYNNVAFIRHIKYREKEWDNIVFDYNNGVRLHEIHKKYNYSIYTIYRILRLFGIKNRNHLNTHKNKQS